MSQKNYKNKKKAASQVKAKNAPVAETSVVAEQPAVTKAAPQAEVKTDWSPIIKDFLILLVIMGILGYACNLLKDAFAPKSPTDSLVSLIRKGDVKDVKGEEIDEPFLKEIKEGKEKDADFINTRDSNARTPLMWTAYANFNDPEKAEETDINRIYYLDELFANGANIHAVDVDGFNALHWAAWSGMRFISYKLVKKGVDINQPEYNGYTPLMLAAMRGNATVVDLLLKMGANPTAVSTEKSYFMQTPLWELA
ncbi:MAG: ankyrin repeat domain-containing protein [Akkermansia sp.]|nr:ankyrin repeat domain-containing protein [Akkermansia sp.]